MATERPEYAALAPFTPISWEGVGAAVDRWKQGDLIGPLPMGWVTHRGLDPVTNLEVDSDEEFLITAAPSAPTLGIITSQTCDVASTGPGQRHAFVQVSPVIEAPGVDANKLASLRRWEVVDLVLLSPAGRTAGSPPLIADLRISVPVSKALLARFEPQPAFDSEDEYLEFARRLAVKVERSALHDFVTVVARGLIRDAIRKDSTANTSWWSQVEEVLVRCEPTRLAPKYI